MSKPVRRHNRNYSGGFPLAVGDRFYSQDIFRNDAYHEAMTGIAYNDLTQQTAPYVINGLFAAQGTGHTMDISAGKAVVPFTVTIPDPSAGWTVPPSTTTANIDMVIDYAGATGVSLTGTTTDGATPNYVKMSYTETNGNTRTRAKKAGSYAYEVYDSVTVTIDAVAPTSTEINLLTFTTNGATVTVTNNGDTRIGSPFHMQDAVVYDQASFNDCIRRVAANQYKIRDDIQSIYCAFLSGGYLMTGGTSPLSGGDTWGYIETNNCTQILFESSAYIHMGNERGYLEVNTDDCYLRNVNIIGTGTVSSAIAQSFLLNANRVTYFNCQTSNRLTNATYYGFKGSTTAAHNLTSKYNNCMVYTIENNSNSNFIHGFFECKNINNCVVYDLDESAAASGTAIGYRDCEILNNCVADNIQSASTIALRNAQGFVGCNILNNCKATNISQVGNQLAYGFSICDNISSCYVDTITATDNSIGYNSCDNVTTSTAINIVSSGADAFGFTNCDYLSSCIAKTIDHNGSVASQNAYGFNSCNNVSSCFADDVDTNGAGGISAGYKSCQFTASCKSENCERGYSDCLRMSACYANNNSTHGFFQCDEIAVSLSTNSTLDGFNNCDRISSSEAANNTRYGFSGCNQLNTCRSAGNGTAQYNNSFADFGGTQAVADTATGGYNG